MTQPAPTPISPPPIALTAVALDDRVDLARLEGTLPWTVRRQYPYARVLAIDERATAYVFHFGAVVVEADVARANAVLREVEAATGRRNLPETREVTSVLLDPKAPTDSGRVGWDQIAVVAQTPERMAAIALLLGQSAALERYELAAERTLDAARRVASELARRGRPPQRTRELMRRMGRITAARLELANWFYLVDRPEEAWEKPEVAALYDALFGNLELKPRHEAMLHKLRAAETAMETTVDLWHARWNHWLEWAIVLLIVVDILLALWNGL